ncbi:uncharacterized protein LOC9634041 [Selaginella moellendorffii]|uniref:uncharacterized protein LOC9634041 n=1 Tax=Selaginella moellendorffii TaxID=88036 RepID=UPI000D1CB002|nr:uncharacterized protein LOC9634041 [Selaginella moellendorffii]|eukprot:XP_024527309.1 uncharacterized protein LOC9634041 [Selaginella moellendorffii]
MRSTLSSLKALFKRKLLESFRVKVAGMFPDAVWNGDVPDVGWWCGFIQDPRSIAALSSASGIGFDMPDACTDELRPRLSSIQQAGGVAAHVITEEPEVYATLVCQYAGASLERMKKIYRLVFGRDAAQDAFGDVGCCKCPVHCPEGVKTGQSPSRRQAKNFVCLFYFVSCLFFCFRIQRAQRLLPEDEERVDRSNITYPTCIWLLSKVVNAASISMGYLQSSGMLLQNAHERKAAEFFGSMELPTVITSQENHLETYLISRLTLALDYFRYGGLVQHFSKSESLPGDGRCAGTSWAQRSAAGDPLPAAFPHVEELDQHVQSSW